MSGSWLLTTHMLFVCLIHAIFYMKISQCRTANIFSLSSGRFDVSCSGGTSDPLFCLHFNPLLLNEMTLNWLGPFWSFLPVSNDP